MKHRIRHHVNPLGILTQHRFAGFGDTKDIIVDIGAYKGEFVAALLERFPQYNYIVMEVRARVAQRLKERFADHDNVAVFDGDGTRNFHTVVKPCQDAGAFVREIYINFPDPWLKKRHKKRRIITQRFLQDTAQWIDPRTTWIFQTDQKSVFDDTVEILQTLGYAYERFTAPPYGITTDWEDAQTARGATIYRLRFWVGVPDHIPTRRSVVTRLGDAAVGAMASIMIRVLYYFRADDGH